MVENTQKPTLIHEREAATYLGMNYHALRMRRTREAKSGKFPLRFVKIMNTVRYDVADLDAYIESVTYTPKGEEK
jgi:hypothetical protein